MKKVLITGGTGFFGKALVSYMRNHGMAYDIYVMSRNPERQYENPLFKHVKFIKADVVDFNSDVYFDSIIHAATDARVDVPDDIMRATIIDGTKNILNFAKRTGCLRVLYISSGGVYGNYDRKINEIDECHPITVYGKSKLVAEKMCLDSGIDVVIARCFALSGRYLNKNIHFALGNFIKDAVEGTDIIIKSDGTSIRSYLDQDDLARNLLILLERAKAGSIYNIGSDQSICLKDLAYKIKNMLNPNINVKILSGPRDIHYKPMYVPNVDRFNKDFPGLGMKSLDASILEMAEIEHV